MFSAHQVVYAIEEISPLVLHSASLLISTFFYGIIFTLTWSCISLLLRTTNTRTPLMTRLFVTYVALMFVLSTINEGLFVGSFFSFMQDSSASGNMATKGSDHSLLITYSPNPFPILLSITTLIVDFLMLWRCVIISSSISRRYQYMIFALPTLLLIGSFVATIVLVPLGLTRVTDTVKKTSCMWIATPFVGLSTLANFYLALFVIVYLTCHRKHLRATLGQGHDSLYQRVTIMLVESFSLIVVGTVVYFILWFTMTDASFIVESSLVHIYAISPILLLMQVAQRKVLPSPPSHHNTDLVFIAPSTAVEDSKSNFCQGECNIVTQSPM